MKITYLQTVLVKTSDSMYSKEPCRERQLSC